MHADWQGASGNCIVSVQARGCPCGMGYFGVVRGLKHMVMIQFLAIP